MDWKQEILKRLDTLAEKLGTTAGYLWHVLVRQAVVEGIAALVIVVITGVLLYVGLKLALWAWKSGNEHVYDDANAEWQGRHIAGFCIGLAIIIPSVLIAVFNLYTTIVYLLNPEYAALERVLQALGK